jgi:dihydrolipoamide dehydrogenase
MRLVILGSGPGGYVAAIKAAQLGAEVTVIEDTEVGGTCLNRGCIPTKALVSSADVLHKTKHLEDFGIELSGLVTPNLPKMMARKDRVTSTMVKGIRSLFKGRGISLIEGRGIIAGQDKIDVTKRDGTISTVEADKVIIATGSRPARIPVFPFDGEHILSSDDALNLTVIPKSLLIIGAGVIGCEFACIFSELGSDVTMLEMLDRPVATEDREISDVLLKELRKKKIKLLTSVKVEKAVVKDDGVYVCLDGGKELKAEKLLVSIGRALNTQDIGLEVVGIKTGPRGEIAVNERMETNVPGFYAVGDVTGGMLLAHVASREGIIAAYNACGIERKMDYTVVPAAIFTSPEIGSVGLREHQAIEKGINIKTGRFQFRGLGKAHAMGGIAGLVKVVADADTDKMLGMHIIGPHASDLVHEGALAMQAGLTARQVADMIHAHPTLAEGIMEAAGDVHDEAIHVLWTTPSPPFLRGNY